MINSNPVYLFSFPFGGGNKFAYISFEDYLPAFIKMVPLEYPGHGERIKAPLLHDIHAIADDLFEEIKPYLQQPYAFYGHSMGSLVGYVVAMKIRKNKLPLPRHLFFSGGRAPSAVRGEKIHLLPKDEFWKKIKEHGALKDKIFEYPELVALFEPIIRADFQAVAEYQHQATPALDVPLTIMEGKEDKTYEKTRELWQKETTYPLEAISFAGGHFFIYDHTKHIAKIIAEGLKDT